MGRFIKFRHIDRGVTVATYPDGSVIRHSPTIDGYPGKQVIIKGPDAVRKPVNAILNPLPAQFGAGGIPAATSPSGGDSPDLPREAFSLAPVCAAGAPTVGSADLSQPLDDRSNDGADGLHREIYNAQR